MKSKKEKNARNTIRKVLLEIGKLLAENTYTRLITEGRQGDGPLDELQLTLDYFRIYPDKIVELFEKLNQYET